MLKKILLLISMPLVMTLAHGYSWHMMDWDRSYYGPGGIIMFIGFLVIIAVGAYFLLRNTNIIKPMKSSTPLEILKERYARGEINKDDFEKIKKDIL